MTDDCILFKFFGYQHLQSKHAYTLDHRLPKISIVYSILNTNISIIFWKTISYKTNNVNTNDY